MSSESTFPVPEPIDPAAVALGRPMESAAAATVDRTVHEHRWCLSCGYDLFGLKRDGVCPECGGAVAKSLEGDLLRNCGREHVERVRLGMLLVGCGAVSVLVIYLVLKWTSALWIARVIGPGFGPVERQLLQTMLLSACGLVMTVGWWVFSSNDTARFGPDPATRTRVFLRVMVILDAVLAVFAAVAMMAVVAWGGLAAGRGGGGFVRTVNEMQWPIWWLVQLVGWFPKMFYVSLLARRVPDRSLASFASVVMWLGLLKLAFCIGEVPCFVLAVIVYVRMVRALDAVLREMPNDRTS